jgi:hypothetical protein
MVLSHPIETLKDLLPGISQSIVNKAEDSLLLVDDRGDPELIWNLSVFGELVQAQGETLLIYQTNIRDVLQRCGRIVHRESNRLVALAIQRLFRSLVEVFVVHSPSNDTNLPIRVSRSLSLIVNGRLCLDVGTSSECRSTSSSISSAECRRNRLCFGSDRNVNRTGAGILEREMLEIIQRRTTKIVEDYPKSCRRSFSSVSSNQRSVNEDNIANPLLSGSSFSPAETKIRHELPNSSSSRDRHSSRSTCLRSVR